MRKKGRYTAIIDLYVKEGFRGRGHGTALLEKVEELAENENCDFITVSSEWENEKARSFYEKHRYEPKQVEFTKAIY